MAGISLNVHYYEIPRVKKKLFRTFATVDLEGSNEVITLFFNSKEDAEKLLKELLSKEWEVQE